jgi:hypothetical protein
MLIKDGEWELFDHDFSSGRTVWRYDDGQQVHFRTDYPVDQIVKDNAVARNEMAGQRWGEGKRIASIPLNVYFDQLNAAQEQDDQKFISKWLNDSDNRAFRTFDGNV